MKAFFKKYRELIDYLFWGVATTAVNYAVYFLLTRLFDFGVVSANVIAWAIAVIFAFVVNRALVFHGNGNLLSEFLLFTGGRIFSGALETGILWLFVDTLHFPDQIIKIIASVIVVILNYIFSKFIFRKKD